MGKSVRIQPDLEFVKELQAVGGDSLKKCYQCATCSVVCPLSPVSAPYPRKEMVWAQWGLKDRLLSDIDIWLCHRCGTCSERCPRGAKPADVLSALRNMTYRKLVPPTIIGTWMSSFKFLPLLAALPALIYGIIWQIRAGVLGTALPLFSWDEATHSWVVDPNGSIVYGGLFPGDYTIDPVFSLVAILVTIGFVVGIKRLLDGFKSEPKTFVIGYKPPTFPRALYEVVVDEIATHRKWKDCGDTAADDQRFKGHWAILFAFVALAIVTTIVAVGHWGGKVIPFIAPAGHTPMALYNPVKILANVGAVLLVVGLFFLTARRMSQDEKVSQSSYYDWYLLGVIWAVALTGIGSEVLRLMHLPAAAYTTYYIHLIAVFMLIAYLPWSKLGHLFYRTVALAYARTIGRLPMGK